MKPHDQDRYSRQILFPPIGEPGQQRLMQSRVTLIGCGALGTVLADTLVRAGVGFLRIVDRDYVEANNLQRQVLFTEKDAEEGRPKAVAAAERLADINSSVRVEPVLVDAHAANIESLIEGAQVILDGTDNFETRFLLNDAAVKHNLPWVYGACVAAEGMVMPILPGVTACLRCLWDEPPPPGTAQTCDTAGVIAPIVHVVAAFEAVEAIKILTGHHDAVRRALVRIDAWSGEHTSFDMSAAQRADCPCCGLRRFTYLQAGGARTAVLCGRRAVQVPGREGAELDFERLAERVAPASREKPVYNRYLLRFEVDGAQVTVFRDGRAIIKGVDSPDEARTLYAKYIGS
jgi:molybdopterin/thiamine biosynthesis adenylyltransferase